ncbi:hypothetical protein F4775DRAFT_107198 [Biscogniauxia sp. FL1348]|nr:hypothetical protein F4775DRAFT_107198 [Biscogniauxia sp. FL1348]
MPAIGFEAVLVACSRLFFIARLVSPFFFLKWNCNMTIFDLIKRPDDMTIVHCLGTRGIRSTGIHWIQWMLLEVGSC